MMTFKLTIRAYGDPCLRKKSIPVKEIGSPELQLIEAMIETMHDHKGVGLAAPQVGINRRIFVADVGDGPVVFINPKIVRRAGSAVLEEGCLSIPGVTVLVTRPEKIVVRYTNEDNRSVERTYTDLMARVIQHENDHLDGKLIVDYASLKEKIKLRKPLKALREKYKG